MSPVQGATRGCAPWPKDALRIAFGIIWLIDATLKWLPGFRSSYMSVIMGEAQGQPGWLRPWFNFWIRFQHPDAMLLAYLAAVIETLIALALIAGFARKLTYLSAIAFSLLIWGTAEGFGGPYTSGASDIGTAIIYAVVFAALLALSYYAGPARFSVASISQMTPKAIRSVSFGHAGADRARACCPCDIALTPFMRRPLVVSAAYGQSAPAYPQGAGPAVHWQGDVGPYVPGPMALPPTGMSR